MKAIRWSNVIDNFYALRSHLDLLISHLFLDWHVLKWISQKVRIGAHWWWSGENILLYNIILEWSPHMINVTDILWGIISKRFIKINVPMNCTFQKGGWVLQFSSKPVLFDGQALLLGTLNKMMMTDTPLSIRMKRKLPWLLCRPPISHKRNEK